MVGTRESAVHSRTCPVQIPLVSPVSRGTFEIVSIAHDPPSGHGIVDGNLFPCLPCPAVSGGSGHGRGTTCPDPSKRGGSGTRQSGALVSGHGALIGEVS